MKLEQQVCSLELAKRLKELGVKQDAILFWIKPNHPRRRVWKIVPFKGEMNLSVRSCAAFSVAEMGELLGFYPLSMKSPEGVRCFNLPRDHFESGTTEANARASLLIYLIEQGLVKP